MISLHNSINTKKSTPTVVPYSFSMDLLNDMGYQEDKHSNIEVTKEVEVADQERNQILSQIQEKESILIAAAKETAEKIISDAKWKAEEIKKIAKEDGYEAGFQLGAMEGKEITQRESRVQLEQETANFLNELQQTIKDLEKEKDKLLKQHCLELSNLAIAVAEKVIQVSLKSSTEVITKMILAATEKSKNKEWARIHISNCDTTRMVNGEADILNALQEISPHVKVVIMENKQPGTCIIEFPDQIIDASVNTQIENIKELIEDRRLDGGL